jgi:hypothetical protein
VKPANLGVSGFAGRVDIAAILPWAPGVGGSNLSAPANVFDRGHSKSSRRNKDQELAVDTPGVRKSAACTIVTDDGRREISSAAFFLG